MAVQRLESVSSKFHFDDAGFHGKASNKVSSSKLLYKKANWICKVIILVALGLSGMYICISGVEKCDFHSRTHKRELSFASDNKEWRRDDCPELSLRANVSVHYPKPQTFDRMECSCTPVHNFVILSMQRSGSGWFETLVNSHPNISSHGEVFSVNGRKRSFSTIKTTLDTLYSLDWRSSATKNDCTAAVGLKWMFNQGVLEYKRDIATYFKDNSVSVIFLLRRNILRRHVSILANSFDHAKKQINGTHMSHVHSKAEAEVLEAYQPTVDLTSLIPYLKRVEDIMDKARSSFQEIRHKTIYYEDLVADPRKEMRKAQKFLGLKPIELTSKHVKIHTRPLHEQIKNWHDLKESLKGTKYEILLNGKDYGS